MTVPIGAITGATTGATAAAAAAQQQRRMQAEEEQMTTYQSDQLNGWEFKILRTSGRHFSDPVMLAEVLREEERSGWQLLEKFDDQRLRLKRHVDRRRLDRGREDDVYRTWVGRNPNQQAAIVLGVVFGVLGVIAVVGLVLANFAS